MLEHPLLLTLKGSVSSIMSIYINVHYVYLIGWSKLNRYYIGSRYSKDCHPSDLWVRYFTSSNVVKLFRKQYGEPDIIQVRKTFLPTYSSGIPVARIYEATLLRRLDAGNPENIQFLNGCNGDNKNFYTTSHSDATRHKISVAAKGKKKTKKSRQRMSASKKGKRKYNNGTITKLFFPEDVPLGFVLGTLQTFSEETRQKMAKSAKNRPPLSEEARQKISQSGKGRICSDETRQKLSAKAKGRRLSEEIKQQLAERQQKSPPVICPHCGKISHARGSMKRWHFDNCKFKTSKYKLESPRR